MCEKKEDCCKSDVIESAVPAVDWATENQIRTLIEVLRAPAVKDDMEFRALVRNKLTKLLDL